MYRNLPEPKGLFSLSKLWEESVFAGSKSGGCESCLSEGPRELLRGLVCVNSTAVSPNSKEKRRPSWKRNWHVPATRPAG